MAACVTLLPLAFWLRIPGPVFSFQVHSCTCSMHMDHKSWGLAQSKEATHSTQEVMSISVFWGAVFGSRRFARPYGVPKFSRDIPLPCPAVVFPQGCHQPLRTAPLCSSKTYRLMVTVEPRTVGHAQKGMQTSQETSLTE